MTPSNSQPRQETPPLNPVAGRIDPTPQPQQAPLRPVQPEPTPAGLTAGPDFKQLMRGLGRRWMLAAILSIVLGGLAGLGMWVLLTPDYTAFAQIKVAFKPGTVIGPPEQSAHFGAFVKGQAAMFKSRPIIQAALRKEEIRKLNLEQDTPDPIAAIEEKLAVSVAETSELMTVTLTHRNEMVAVALMKALTESYMDSQEYEKTARAGRDADLDKAIADLQGEIKKKRDALQAKTRQTPNIDPEIVRRQREEIGANIRELRPQRTAIRADLAQKEAALKAQDLRLEVAKKFKVDDAQVEAALRSDPTIAPLFGRVQTAEAVMAYYRRAAQEPEKELPYTRARKELADAEGQISSRRFDLRRELTEKTLARVQEEVEFTKTQLKEAIVTAQGNLTKIEADLTAQAAELDKLPSTQVLAQADALDKEATGKEDTLKKLVAKAEENRLNSRLPERITMHQEAALMRKGGQKQYLGALVTPFVVAGAICFLLAYGDYRQRRVYSAQEVSGGLGIRVVGAVPPVPGLERRLVSPTGEAELEGHPVLESIDALRTTLLRESQRERRRVILVTSAGAGEGKTTLAASLAISLARAGRKTLLIDGDLRSPAVNQLFEIPLQPGFSEVVLAEVDAVDAIQPSTVDNLSVLPAGQWDREVLTSLARDGLEGVLEKLREEYDFILIDSHPILSATDSLLLAQRVDGVLLAVLRGVSQMPRVYAATQRLNSLGVKVLGAVMIAGDPEEVLTSAPSQPVPLRA